MRLSPGERLDGPKGSRKPIARTLPVNAPLMRRIRRRPRLPVVRVRLPVRWRAVWVRLVRPLPFSAMPLAWLERRPHRSRAGSLGTRLAKPLSGPLERVRMALGLRKAVLPNACPRRVRLRFWAAF